MIASEVFCPVPERGSRIKIPTLVAALVVLSAPLLGGCSQNKDAFTKQLNQVKADIVQLRAENLALQDRLAELEDEDKAVVAAKPPTKKADDRPNLKVVRLTPDDGPAPQSIIPETDGKPATANDEPPLDLKLDGEGSSPKAYRHHRSRR